MGGVLRMADAAFWFVLVLAVAMGGRAALAGLPRLSAVLLPSGLMAAEAHAEQPASIVTLPLVLPRAVAPRVSAPVDPKLPAIAIVIDDLGAAPDAARRAIALPRAVTLSFLPYADTTPALARAAEDAGHQVIAHVPMQALGRADPGPMALRVDLPPRENLRRLAWALARVPGLSGINNHEGSRFTADRAALVPVMEALADRHVFFFDSRTTAQTDVVPLARAFGVASAGRDVFLDDIQTPDAVNTSLQEIEADARIDGVAIAIGHPHDATLTALAAWCAQLKTYRLVPLSVAIRMKTERAVVADMPSPLVGEGGRQARRAQPAG